MGEVKFIAARIATMVYHQRMKDEDIIRALRTWDVDGEVASLEELWLEQQIAIVRENPGLFKPMAGSI